MTIYEKFISDNMSLILSMCGEEQKYWRNSLEYWENGAGQCYTRSKLCAQRARLQMKKYELFYDVLSHDYDDDELNSLIYLYNKTGIEIANISRKITEESNK